MALMLKGARLIDPQVGLDEVADILIRDGRIVEIGHDLVMEKGVERDLSGKVIVPGLVDMHVHLREPGFEQKEDIASGTRAAAHGSSAQDRVSLCCPGCCRTPSVVSNSLASASRVLRLKVCPHPSSLLLEFYIVRIGLFYGNRSD